MNLMGGTGLNRRVLGRSSAKKPFGVLVANNQQCRDLIERRAATITIIIHPLDGILLKEQLRLRKTHYIKKKQL